MISTITNDHDEQRHIVNSALVHSNMYESDRLTQVKTYTDHGNGYGQRSGGTTHYSKVGVAGQAIFLITLILCIILTNQLLQFFSLNSYRLVANVPILIWIHKRRRAKTVSPHRHCNETVPISICRPWTVIRRDMFVYIIQDIVRTRFNGE